jgi:hypothetical protein
MKTYKKIDLWIQIALMALGILWGLIIAEFRLVFSYIAVGSVQVISAIVHLFLSDNYTPHRARKFYGIIVFILVFLLTFMFNTDYGIGFGFVMLIISPILAIWYIWICSKEKKLLENASEKQTESSDFYEM